VNDHSIRLKDDDAPPPPPDPQTIGAQHMALLRSISAATNEIFKMVQGWHEDPIGGQRRIQARVLELQEMADRAEGSGERVMQSKRFAGHFSHQYGDDLGVR
jgi:cytochrome c peroxidase